MKYVDEFRAPGLIAGLARALAAADLGGRPYRIMEVCGTHTMAIGRFGLRRLLPEGVKLISGPGCPVCVTPKSYLDRAAALGRAGVTLATFGDMMRVPASTTDLLRLRAEGADVRVVYSTLDALAYARERPDLKVVFLAVGFETTAPTVAAALKRARAEGVANFFVLAAHKLIPPAMRALCRAPGLALDGFLCPAHVSAVIGGRAYDDFPRDYGVGCAIAGFEPADILRGVYLLLAQRAAGVPRVDNEYTRVVKDDGNAAARAVMAEVFEPADAEWRGFGVIPASGLRLRDEYAAFDAARAFDVAVEPTAPDMGCRCGDVLSGALEPEGCALFGAACTPESPVGPCMVSSEGTCAAAYKYRP
jgi:hydrogenase expression/formation protein HypD